MTSSDHDGDSLVHETAADSSEFCDKQESRFEELQEGSSKQHPKKGEGELKIKRIKDKQIKKAVEPLLLPLLSTRCRKALCFGISCAF